MQAYRQLGAWAALELSPGQAIEPEVLVTEPKMLAKEPTTLVMEPQAPGMEPRVQEMEPSEKVMEPATRGMESSAIAPWMKAWAQAMALALVKPPAVHTPDPAEA